MEGQKGRSHLVCHDIEDVRLPGRHDACLSRDELMAAIRYEMERNEYKGREGRGKAGEGRRRRYK